MDPTSIESASSIMGLHGAGEVGDVIGERKMRIESNTKITDRGIMPLLILPSPPMAGKAQSTLWSQPVSNPRLLSWGSYFTIKPLTVPIIWFHSSQNIELC